MAVNVMDLVEEGAQRAELQRRPWGRVAQQPSVPTHIPGEGFLRNLTLRVFAKFLQGACGAILHPTAIHRRVRSAISSPSEVCHEGKECFDDYRKPD
jgi:hypothetical protein